MKKIFTLLFVLAVTFSFAQRGIVTLESGSKTDMTPAKDDNGTILMPGTWDNVTGVGTYRWVDSNDNSIHLGWIFGNNVYGDQAVGQKFVIQGTMEIHGAYFWVSAAAEGVSEEVHFNVHAWNDGPGDWLGGKSVPLNEVLVYATGEGVGPGDYLNTFYVEFDNPIEVSSDFFMAVGFGGLPWEAHGDGLGMATSLLGAGGGALNHAYIQNVDGVWNTSQQVNAGLVMDLGIFPHVSFDTFTVTFVITDEDGTAIEDAVVTFDGVEYAPGHYAIEDVPEGTYDYMVVKDGFETVAETINVTEDKTVEVTMVEEVLEPEEYVYSIAMMLPAGEYDYKYFLVVDNPTWELGEWVGDPNRSVMVNAEMTVQDIWGEQPKNGSGDPAKDGHDEYIVTFKVTIEEGTLVGDIAFDPDEHHIFIAGSFPGDWHWSEPGSNPVLELTTTDDDPIVSTFDISTVDVAVNIFPNPASDLFYIESDAQISEIRMFDVLGQVIYVNEANDTHHAIRVGGMNAGVYFVQITTQAGIVTQRVQVTR